ncbi:MAG: TolC family protein, partial [Melioribacteraceae bacterium]|nr:TolC family protein [Melioribacteraceae bacterium]
MKTILSLISIVALLTASFQLGIAKQQDRVNISIVFDGPNYLNKMVLNLVKEEILELTKSEFDVNFPEDQIFDGNWNVADIKSVISKLLLDDNVDFIITLGAVASDIISKEEKLSKPVIAPFIVDAKIQGLLTILEESPIENLNFIEVPFTTPSTLQEFQNLIEFEKLAILYSDFYIDAMPLLEEKTNRIAENLGIRTYSYRLKDSIGEIIEKLPSDIEAVYLSPILELDSDEYTKLILELKRRKLPSFSVLGLRDVERGVLATNRSNLFPRIARRIALNLQRILLGDKPEEIDAFFAPSENLTINMRTAREINIHPKWDVLIEADLINEEESDIGSSLDLKSVMNLVISNNLDLLSRKKNISASAENVNIAKSNLLPQIDMSATGLLIDKDRAESSFGSQPEKTITGRITATQLLFSEPAWANLSIQNSLQKSKEFEFEQLKLDISLLAAVAFLNVLKAK